MLKVFSHGKSRHLIEKNTFLRCLTFFKCVTVSRKRPRQVRNLKENQDKFTSTYAGTLKIKSRFNI